MLLLPATLTTNEARDTLRMLAQALQREAAMTPVVVNASGLQQFDTSALAVLLEIQRLAVAWGATSSCAACRRSWPRWPSSTASTSCCSGPTGRAAPAAAAPISASRPCSRRRP